MASGVIPRQADASETNLTPAIVATGGSTVDFSMARVRGKLVTLNFVITCGLGSTGVMAVLATDVPKPPVDVVYFTISGTAAGSARLCGITPSGDIYVYNPQQNTQFFCSVTYAL